MGVPAVIPRARGIGTDVRSRRQRPRGALVSFRHRLPLSGSGEVETRT